MASLDDQGIKLERNYDLVRVTDNEHNENSKRMLDSDVRDELHCARKKSRSEKLENCEKDLNGMREQHGFGSNQPKRRVMKPSERFRAWSFDWDDCEDTSRDMDALYRNPHEARLYYWGRS